MAKINFKSGNGTPGKFNIANRDGKLPKTFTNALGARLRGNNLFRNSKAATADAKDGAEKKEPVSNCGDAMMNKMCPACKEKGASQKDCADCSKLNNDDGSMDADDTGGDNDDSMANTYEGAIKSILANAKKGKNGKDAKPKPDAKNPGGATGNWKPFVKGMKKPSTMSNEADTATLKAKRSKSKADHFQAYKAHGKAMMVQDDPKDADYHDEMAKEHFAAFKGVKPDAKGKMDNRAYSDALKDLGIMNGGAGYAAIPTVVISGGSNALTNTAIQPGKNPLIEEPKQAVLDSIARYRASGSEPPPELLQQLDDIVKGIFPAGVDKLT